jgi:hypothetical protein
VLLLHPLGGIQVLDDVLVTYGVAPSFHLSFGCPGGDSCLDNKTKKDYYIHTETKGKTKR